MNKLSLRIFFTKRFIRELRILRSWMDENVSPQKGKQFLLELDDFIIHKVAPYPSHFMEWPLKRTLQKIYRRALFLKKYVLVFKYFGNQVEFVLIYHQKRNPKRLKI